LVGAEAEGHVEHDAEVLHTPSAKEVDSMFGSLLANT
jgi:hypothetical protein